MATNAHILTQSELFDRYIRKFRSICDMHGVQFGSPENFPGFMHKLTEDRHFAMDFWAFAGKLSRRDGGKLSNEHMLAVIVEGIAGDDIPEADDELKSGVNQLAALLAGVEVQGPLRSYVEPLPFPRTEPDSQSSASEGMAQEDDEMLLRVSSSHPAFFSEAVDRQAGTAPSVPSTLSSPRVVFISEAGAASSSSSTRSSSHRAVFISDAVDGEADPVSSVPYTLPSSHRAVFTSDAVDGEAGPASSVPSTRSSSHRAVFVSDAVYDEAGPASSSSSTRSSSHRAVFISDAVDGQASPASSLRPRLSSSPLPVRNSGVVDASPASSLPSTQSSQLVEALRWLQLSSLELKQRLNEIDEKMSRLEPHRDELTSDRASSKAKLREPVEEPAAPPVKQFTREPAGKPRAALRPDEWPGAELLASAFGRRWREPSPVPLETYAQPRGPHGKALFVALVLVVAGSVSLLRHFDLVPRYGAPLYKGYRALVQNMDSPVADQVRSTNESAASPTRTTAEAAETEVSAAAAMIKNIVNPPATRGTSSPPRSSSASGRPAPTALGGSQAAMANLNSPTSRRAISDRSEARAEEAAPAATDVPRRDGTAPVNVAPAVMEANLVLSRVPAYPDAAKAGHVAGPVVVKAIISRAGTVQEVHVIEGDPLLRSAAAEAIYKWRYRPYRLHGQPVQVATTITVDFKPKR